MFQLADELGLPTVVTNDAHYLRREDADMHDTLLCIQTGALKSDTDRLSFDGQEAYFKSPDEMSALFPDRPELVANTLEIANSVGVQFEKKLFLPGFPVPEQFEDDAAHLRHLAEEGAKERYGDNT